jgi:hypothetical protein
MLAVLISSFWRLWEWLVLVEQKTRPVQLEENAFYQRRYDSLPPHVKTPSQIIGRSTMGCEGKKLFSFFVFV